MPGLCLDIYRCRMAWSHVVCTCVTSLLLMYSVQLYYKYSLYHITNLCEAYAGGSVTGSLCHELCHAKSIQIHTTLTVGLQKHVHQATWRDKEIIVKSQFYTQRTKTDMLRSLKGKDGDYRSMIADKVFTLFGECQNCWQLTSRLVHIADTNNDGELSLVETDTILELLKLPEPTMLLILNGSKHSLDMYGYCGNLYAVERISVIADAVYGMEWSFKDFTYLPDALEPLENIIEKFMAKMYDSLWLASLLNPTLMKLHHLIYRNIIQEKIPTLEEKFNFSLSLLDAILEVNSNPYGLLQSCDTHLGNFGLTTDSVVKFIDYDLTYPKYFVEGLLGAKECGSNDDCIIGDFHECISQCDSSTGFCKPILQSQDMENIYPPALRLLFHYDVDDSVDSTDNFGCLDKAINDIMEFCASQGLVETAVELKSKLMVVKKKLENLHTGQYTCS